MSRAGAAASLDAIPFLDLSGTTQAVRDEVLARWNGLLDVNAFVGGEAVQRFEDAWAAYCDRRYAIGMANGTDALHLSMRALGIGPGDEVVVPANTFVATAEAVVLAGAQPAFADVDPDTLLLTPETLAAAVTPRTRAVAVVHLYGQMPDMDALCRTADELDLLVIEDMAQAQGAAWRGRRAGSFGAAGCTSFYPGKNLGAFGDAGAVVTDDPELAQTLRALRDHGRAGGTAHHDHAYVGTNSRLDALQAVVLEAKLSRLDDWNTRRRDVAAVYHELLDRTVVRPVSELEGSRGVYHLAVVRVHDRDRVRSELAELGIGTGIHYATPCHLMSPYRHLTDRPLPTVEADAAQLLSLPMSPFLSVEDAERVAKTVNEVAARDLR
ncbi:DegT/DnrJ/EryC1/StrS family aminotransferase [Nocardioides iriomotensis]|uniref:DegT/DnrJ/EryC1/StrS family aminotransferase n=1 Tax=Nocardioides iriomotensis TaxID=715784 RepID=A0A4Q5JA80_9ACTN|nr:DegT/DnrJ/EryC1/StrS family aminotransferase [Nocardioides iriomotensis]RYU15640.1 DegT/DnrJ/EryC1/StrS family aminotransferase [Nocardioides iriomotensis]